MIEEPFRFVEAIANRREYIESQLVGGSPIVAMNYNAGVLLFTLGREKQKIFEVYDRIAMGAIGHPGDIERLRMTAIELASTEGFTRSAADVSLRRMANFSLSPALKAAFEQVYGAPFLARLLFVELGDDPASNTFLRIDYDGAIKSNGSPRAKSRLEYGVLSGTKVSEEQMKKFLAEHFHPNMNLTEALRVSFDAWAVGNLIGDVEESDSDDALPKELPDTRTIRAHQRERLEDAGVEAAVLNYKAPSLVTYHSLTEEEIQPFLHRIEKHPSNE